MSTQSPSPNNNNNNNNKQNSVNHTDIILQSLMRLPQLAKIHQPNNKILVDNLELFRLSLLHEWENVQELNLRAHRGRIYYNNAKVNPASPAMNVSILKLMEFWESKGFYGFKFQKKEDITQSDLVDFIRAVNNCQGQEKPSEWLAQELQESWAKPIVDQDFKITISYGSGEDGKPSGKAMVWNSGTRTLAAKAKRSYSRALAEASGLQEKLMSGETVSVAKSRRVVQDMVEALFQEEKLLLNLSTIRDYDDYTCTHCVNVAILSMCLGKRIGLSKLSVVTLGLTGLFHDLGKVDIPIELIRKTSRFTNEEYEMVKHHSLFSVLRILQINADHKLKSRLILPPFEHHLGVDLLGYPHSNKQSPLSLFGRIVAIADHYDALTSSRSYRPVPMNPEQALDIMTSLSGKALDPLLLKVFINMVGIYPIGTLLITDLREVTMVAETPSDAIDARPLVYLLHKREGMIERGDLINLSDQNLDGTFVRNILRCFHPADFGLNPADILL
ncbi:MAG: HD domain-containing protein [Deltaproteobacteria bacterium]|jgi:HD-GYP domain-containing protein (c-di-GMP phosphodiesterase class II)|nr:HD domain-containing protein [Deltaproteobacteria bacterium]